MNQQNDQSLMYSLGGFVGGILAGVRTPEQRAKRQSVEFTERDGVRMKRTIIEEIEVKPGADKRVVFGSLADEGAA